MLSSNASYIAWIAKINIIPSYPGRHYSRRQYNEEKEALRTEIESVQSQYNDEKQALSRIYLEY